jgi:hypothetical protein
MRNSKQTIVAYGLSAMLGVVAVMFLGSAAMAQSTIFNIPTTDTVAKKKVYLEFDSFTQAPKFDGAPRTEILVPRAVVGLSNNLEAGLNVSVTHSGGTNLTYLQPDIKWKFFNDEKTATAGSLGVILNAPMNYTKTNDTWALLYGNLSKKVGKSGPRLTAGPYGVVGGDSNNFHGLIKAGALVGFEQVVYKRLSFVSDWFSGKNFYGYWTPGISIALPKNSLFNAGYAIGNDSWKDSNATKNRYVFLYYGITL